MLTTTTYSIFIYTLLTTLISTLYPSSLAQSTLQQQYQAHPHLLSYNDPKVCEQGNRFKHISKHTFDKQNDLLLTFGAMQGNVLVDKVVYKDQLFRTYTIFPLNMTLTYSNLKQIATPVSFDRIRISGGTLKINYSFKWEKKQLSSSIQGTGKGVVNTDAISFIKSLDINSQTKKLQWNYASSDPITITNSLTLSEISPYKQGDYDVINQMLNQLKSGQATIKTKLISAMNANFSKILKQKIHQNNQTYNQPQFISYSYSDYHGDFTLGYDNYILNLSLANGLDLLLSQSIQNDGKFECGDKIPDVPENQSIYGGIQEFISNSLIKSTLRYAINKGFLDVVMTEEFWQSPAFQFYVGDLHQVMPSTKNISTLQPITGRCRALDDKYFDLKNKTANSYQVSVNFTCDFKIFNNTKRLIGINLAVDYQVGVILQAKYMDFVIKSIGGAPTFYEEEDFKIKNMDLALFMIQQTLNMAVGGKVIGSGFKTLDRKLPSAQVREKYLLLYDAATKLNKKKKVIQQIQ